MNVALPTVAAPERPGLHVRLALLVAANVIGLAAFLWPFALPALAPGLANHQADGPWLLLALGGILTALLFLELGRGGLGPKVIALLGVLGAAMVALRLPGFVAGFSAMFLIVLVGGNAFGSSFGFLLGAVGTFASGLFVGGLGPWLPFQMVAVGWMGAGAGLVPRGRTWTARLLWLAGYGAAAGYLYGAIMNLWSWPFLVDGSAIAWDPDAGPAANLHHYLAFYVVTSFWWDTARAVGNAALILVLGKPLLAALDRAARRMHLETGPRAFAAGSSSEAIAHEDPGSSSGAVAHEVGSIP
jgi:energy-coupling factor transport system substrate-specific component